MHHRSSQFGHLHGFFTARGPKWRPPVNSATQQSRKVSPLVFVRPLSVARRPWSPVTRERASIVTGIMNGPSLFSLIRASRRPCHASRASFVEKNNIQPPSPSRFRAFPITSSLIDTSLPLRIIHQLSLCLPFPSLPFHTRIRTNRLPPPCFPRSPLCILPLFLSTVLSLYLSISLYHSIVKFDLSSSRSRVGEGRT